MSKWLDNAVFYEIYPQSFNDTNSDGIGDFEGIIEKLDYIKSLGCNALWLNPCFESPFGDAGYDVSDYYTVAKRYGTNEDLVRLFDEVHKRDMHILLDLVPGHTATEHKWFKESMKAQRNEFTDRYVWTDSIWESPEIYGCIRGISDRDGSCVVNFFSHQPALNYGYYNITRPWQQPVDAEGPKATLREMKNIISFWLGLGADGFRVDMAGSLVKDDPDQEGTIALWQDVRAFLDKEYPNAAMIAEWGHPERALRGGFHMDFLLHFGPSRYNDLFRCEKPYFSKQGKGDISEFFKTYFENYNKSNGGLICIPSGNHDMDRLARKFDSSELELCFGFILTMPGAPFIYYGDEIGMRYVEGLDSVEGGYGRTGSRSPMQWSDRPNAGFSSAPKEKLYIPIDPDPNRPTVKKALEDKASLYYVVKELIELRQAHKPLQSNGKIELIYAEKDKYPFAFTRSEGGEKLLIIINPAGYQASFESKIELKELIYKRGEEPKASNGEIIAPPQSMSVYRI